MVPTNQVKDILPVNKLWLVIMFLVLAGCAQHRISDADFVGRWNDTREEYTVRSSGVPLVGPGRSAMWFQFNRDHTFTMMTFFYGTWRREGSGLMCRPKQYYPAPEFLNNNRDPKSRYVHEFPVVMTKDRRELHLKFRSKYPEDFVTVVLSKS